MDRINENLRCIFVLFIILFIWMSIIYKASSKYLFSTPPIKYENLALDIELKEGRPIEIKEFIYDDHDKKYLYVIYSIKNSNEIGLVIYEKVFINKYIRLAANKASSYLFNIYYITDACNDRHQLYIVYGKNNNRRISHFELDFGDIVKKEDISQKDYYLIVNRFKDKNMEFPKTTFFDSKNIDITRYILEK
ncbi:hypothetical protein [Tissierella praeacuta]|uniref:hypothetical protein n=1 Tax=Tissierella praeacuta TaxID=43131 RepID=UPI002FD8804F